MIVLPELRLRNIIEFRTRFFFLITVRSDITMTYYVSLHKSNLPFRSVRLRFFIGLAVPGSDQYFIELAKDMNDSQLGEANDAFFIDEGLALVTFCGRTRLKSSSFRIRLAKSVWVIP